MSERDRGLKFNEKNFQKKIFEKFCRLKNNSYICIEK